MQMRQHLRGATLAASRATVVGRLSCRRRHPRETRARRLQDRRPTGPLNRSASVHETVVSASPTGGWGRSNPRGFSVRRKNVSGRWPYTALAAPAQNRLRLPVNDAPCPCNLLSAPASNRLVHHTLIEPNDLHPEITDLQAIDEVNRGNREMFEVLVRRYNRQLFRVGLSYLRQHEQTEDAMQNTYLKAFVHLGNFQKQASFST